MANEPRKGRVTDAQVEASQQIYNVAREQADLEMAKLKAEIAAEKDDSFALGTIKANQAHRTCGEVLDALVLYRVHKNKSYKKGGLTWEAFCEAAGYERRTADNIIADIAPIVERFSEKLSGLSGLGLSEIRYLGKTKAAELSGFDENGNLIIGEETIPGTRADVLAYIKTDKEKHKQEIDDRDATIKAKDRVLQDKEKSLEKLNKEIAKLEGKAREKELTPAEDGFLKNVEMLRLGFDGYMLRLDPTRMEELSFDAEPAPTPRMRAAYLTALDYMKKQILVAVDAATEMYGNPIMCPEAAYQPGTEWSLPPEDAERAAKLSKTKNS